MIDRDLFVSYGTRDAKDVAEDLVADLEARGIVCWLAPRDIPAGSRSWASEIVKGIRSSANFLLLLSAGANASEEIEKELDEAARQRKPLFVIRIEDIEPSEGLGYHLNRVQWRDLFRNREVVLNEIVARVVALRDVGAKPSPVSLVPPIMAEMPHAATTPADLSADLPVATRRRGGSPALMAAGLFLTTLVATAGWFLSGGRDMPGQPDAAVAIASSPGPAAPPAVQIAAQPPPAGSLVPPGMAPPVTPVASSDPSDQQGALIRAILSANPATVEAAQRAQRYLAAPRDRALAASTAASETWFAATAPSLPAAREWALERCELRFAKPCGLVAVNEAAVAPFRVSPMPRIAYSGSFDPAMIPVVTEERRSSREVQNYRSAPGFKAAAIHAWGGIFLANGAVTQRGAEETALSACNGDPGRAGREGPCLLYASGTDVVLARRAVAALSVVP